MRYKIVPPSSWIESSENNEKINVYEEILEKYKDNEVIFKLIKLDGKVKFLYKKDCKKYSENLSQIIYKKALKDITNNQHKIMAILSASEESIIFMLASLRLGAHHCICFEDLSEIAILKRLEIFRPDLILCKTNLSNKIKNVLEKYEDKNTKLFVLNLEDLENFNYDKQSFKNIYSPNSSLFTLFTSGSTGFPKAITHNVRSYLNYAKYSTNYFFGINKRSIIFTAVDAGWINGHTYAFYGPLLLGAVSVINENPIFISMPDLLAQYLADLEIDCFYTSVTQLRLIKSVVSSEKKLSNFTDKNINLERIGSCGEPLAHSVGKWALKFFKPTKCSIVNTYFQTETGGVLVAPREEDGNNNDFSCVGKPNPKLGLNVANNLMSHKELVDEGLEPNELLVCNKWDGVFKEIISDKDSKYFTKSGFFRLSDVGHFDKDGFLYIGGRSDDVINVSGHRISSSEIESISLSLDQIIEACAVSIPDSLSGSRVILFITPNSEENNLSSKLKIKLQHTIIDNLSSFHLPKEIYIFRNLPKTKSGKIMRRIMRDLVIKKTFDKSMDFSTLANMDKFLESKNQFLNFIQDQIN